MCVGECVCAYTSAHVKCPIQYVKIYRSSGTFDTPLSLAIFDKDLVWQVNLGLPKILPQCPLEILSAAWLLAVWQLLNYKYKFATYIVHILYLLTLKHLKSLRIFQLCNIYLHYIYSNNITSILDHISITN